ncbi:PREDICTED: uncharacterized protein LOC109174848 [Ipomoea nil]|uniref:uncharacterized protein LOC109174848 n=1 Tax=Ipomoea nil TaxID=35883 RepID=UPI00090154B6|nr:PREDICTED: uncharacterized protein LOC109174848 [Ipomoea nil]
MVSERRSYLAAVTGSGDASQGEQHNAQNNQSPIMTPSTAILQQVLTPTTGISQRSSPSRNLRRLNAEELENPLSLSANDRPCTVLVSPPLAGSSNYGTWSISMQISLEVKNKWSIVDGSFSPPSRDQYQYAAWRRCNLMICSWLFKSVSPPIAQSVMHLDRARDVWEDLRRRFAQRDAQRISLLQNEIYSLR